MFDEYLEELDDDDRRALSAVIDHVRALVPDAEAGRSYGLPAFRYRGRPLLGFGASKDHLAVYPFSPAVIDGMRERLDGFVLSKGTVRFTSDHLLPEDVITDLVRGRMAEIDG